MRYLLLVLLLLLGCDSEGALDEMPETIPSLSGRWSAYHGESDSTITFYELSIRSTGGMLSGTGRIVVLEHVAAIRDNDMLGRNALLTFGDTLYAGVPGPLAGTFAPPDVRFVVDNTQEVEGFVAGVTIGFEGDHYFSRSTLGRTIEGRPSGVNSFFIFDLLPAN